VAAVAVPAATYPALFGLIAATGLRVSEAINLDDSDADLAAGVLTIRDSKFRKTRQIPVHPATAAALLSRVAGPAVPAAHGASAVHLRGRHQADIHQRHGLLDLGIVELRIRQRADGGRWQGTSGPPALDNAVQ
jgi:integrase